MFPSAFLLQLQVIPVCLGLFFNAVVALTALARPSLTSSIDADLFFELSYLEIRPSVSGVIFYTGS